MSDRFGVIGQVDERQLRLLVRDWRRGRADRNLFQAIQDAYVAVFALVVIGAMLISSILQAQRSVSSCSSESCLAARGLLPWAAVAGFLALALVAARMFGPVVASAAEGFWIMDGNVDRRRVLTGRLVASVIVALLAGGGLGALIAALVGGTGTDVITWGLAAGFGCFGLVAFAAAEQGVERRWITTVLLWLIGFAAFGALVFLVAISAGFIPVGSASVLSVDFAWAVAGGGLLLGLASIVPAWVRLRDMRRQRLTAGSSLLAGMQGAAFALDFALVRDILVEDQARRRGYVRPTRGSGSGAMAIVLRDLQRLWRTPRPLVFWAASMAVPYAVHALGIEGLNPSISALVLMAALIGFCNTLRVLTRTKGLQRCFPFSPGEVRQAAMAVPALLALIWAVATMPAFGGIFGGGLDLATGFSSSLITAFAGLLAAFRWVSAKPPNYGGPMVSVGIGAMPPGMMFSFIRGIDIVALITLPLIIGWPAWVSLGIAVVTWLFLRSGIDQQSLMAQREEQQRLLDEQKAARSGQKIKVQRRR